MANPTNIGIGNSLATWLPNPADTPRINSDNNRMIPSTPRRTWLFLGASLFLFFAPDLLVPQSWQQNPLYPRLTACYLGGLVILGFACGPAICRAMVVRELDAGPWRSAVDQALAALPTQNRPMPRVVLAKHAVVFVLTAGLLPGRCQVFVSSALVGRLSQAGLRFLLVRAYAHASLRQRMAASLPVLCLTVLVPDTPEGFVAWLTLGGFLLIWLLLHWYFELDADRQAARLVGMGASPGLFEVLAATASPLGRLSLSPPLAWRMRAIGKSMSK